KILDFALAASGASPLPRPRATFTGRFANMWAVTDIVPCGEGLFALSPDDDDPGRHATRLEFVDPDTLRIASTNGYGSPGGRPRPAPHDGAAAHTTVYRRR